MSYYDGTKLLSLKDANGNKPEIYVCDGNRTAGKTTFFNRWFTKRFITHREQFMLVYRYSYELSAVTESFFGDIKSLFFPNYNMSMDSIARGSIKVLKINDKACGFAVYLNNVDIVKKNSHLFNKVMRMLFDEFQSESGNYCKDEVNKLLSLHTSVARGQGEQVRYVPIYMISNSVSIINPYYLAMGIHKRLKDDTKFLRGDGWVLEHSFNTSARDAQLSSSFNRALMSSKYTEYSAENIYLNDNKTFIENMQGDNRYLLTFRSGGKNFAIREYACDNTIYCDQRVDITYPIKIVRDVSSHKEGYTMINNGVGMVILLKQAFSEGLVRFKDQECKNAFMDLMAIKI